MFGGQFWCRHLLLSGYFEPLAASVKMCPCPAGWAEPRLSPAAAGLGSPGRSAAAPHCRPGKIIPLTKKLNPTEVLCSLFSLGWSLLFKEFPPRRPFFGRSGAGRAGQREMNSWAAARRRGGGDSDAPQESIARPGGVRWSDITGPPLHRQGCRTHNRKYVHTNHAELANVFQHCEFHRKAAGFST